MGVGVDWHEVLSEERMVGDGVVTRAGICCCCWCAGGGGGGGGGACCGGSPARGFGDDTDFCGDDDEEDDEDEDSAVEVVGVVEEDWRCAASSLAQIKLCDGPMADCVSVVEVRPIREESRPKSPSRARVALVFKTQSPAARAQFVAAAVKASSWLGIARTASASTLR